MRENDSVYNDFLFSALRHLSFSKGDRNALRLTFNVLSFVAVCHFSPDVVARY